MGGNRQPLEPDAGRRRLNTDEPNRLRLAKQPSEPPAMRHHTILIGGDVCPFGRVENAFRNGDASTVFHNLVSDFAESDFVLVNLECPFVDQLSPIPKAGPAYGADPQCALGLKNAHIHAVNLANNHIMDHGARGLRVTMDTCDAKGISYVGAGRNVAEASRLLIRTFGNVRVAVLAMAEREFSIADRDSWGANPLDAIDFCRTVKAAQGQYDRLIVLLHAGAELFPYPSPRLQKTCRFLVEQGAHAIICQHSHCAGVCEIYRDTPIVYGQGNLIHDIANMTPPWYSGFLVRLIIAGETPCFEMELVPYHQSRERPGASRMTPVEEAAFRQEMDERVTAIGDPARLECLWRDFCATQKPMYFSYLRAHNRLFRRMNNRVNFAEHLFSRESLLVLLDLFRCDTHREALERILEDAAHSSPKHGQLPPTPMPESESLC